MFDSVDPRQSFPDLEKGILQYWREEDVFKRSIKQHCIPGDVLDHQGEKGKLCFDSAQHDTFSFYDGPPFATGLPHYGHLLAGTIKDVIPRYQTMRGKKVERRFGWDCHGLPVENLVEQEQGLKSKKDIEAKGVRWFNDQCRSSVQRYTKEWKKTVERMGRWVDMDWDYRTMDPDFMESIWWAFSELHRKGLIYEGRKSMHVCPRCMTPLSNFEVTLGYKDVADWTTITVFPLVDEPDTALLAWTTTSWTLPGNLFLAVGPSIAYAKVKVEEDSRTYVVAEKLVENIFKGKEHQVIGTISARELIGKKYEPLFPYFAEEYKKQNAFRVVLGDFVTTEDGTGIVHVATGFGDDDYMIGKREGVEVLSHVGMDGRFIPAVTDFAGEEVKPADDPTKTDKKVAAYLKDRGRLFDQHSYTHSYPHCWRCDSPLINYATSSWFVSVEKIKKDLLAQNAKTNWIPENIRDGRFGQWLTNARDWAISRNRYWGTPLPIWRCEETGEIEVIGSRDELMEKCPIRFTKLTVLRHAESEGNLTPIYQGCDPGTNLTEKGRGQAEEVALRLSSSEAPRGAESRGFFNKIISRLVRPRFTRARSLEKSSPVTIIYASPLARARQTAEAISKETGAQIIIDPRLREVHFGDWEGKTVDFSDLTFVKERRAHKIEKGKPESIYHFEGMETWESVQDRVKAFMEDILPKHRGEHVVVVTHADPVINIKHFFTKEDPLKLSHQPYPEKAKPYVYFFDHERKAALDLHKDTVDDIVWMSKAAPSDATVQVTLVRHGQTELNNEKKVQGGNSDTSLNATGRLQAEETSRALRGKSFDVIVCSDAKRAVETAEILGKELSIPTIEKLPLLRERNAGEWSGRKSIDILKENPTPNPATNPAFHTTTPPGGESFSAFLERMKAAAEELVRRYAGKNILLVSHRGTMEGLMTVAHGLSHREACEGKAENAEWRQITITPFMRRIGDVLDCWFESGSMPYAQSHFPFEQGGVGAPRCGARARQRHAPTEIPEGFPADFIAEGLDQTRGWFYTLMVLSTALFQKPAFKNCIVNGIVLAEDGKKMSKRLKNYPEPDLVMDKHGADAMRFTLMASPAVRGESLRFSEKAVEETVRRVILPLWNAYSFFVLHANEAQWSLDTHGGVTLSSPSPFDWAQDELHEGVSKGGCRATRDDISHPLDSWIRAEVQDLANRMTKELDRYDLSATCSELYETLDALTNWYVRRSRRRFAGKEGDAERRVALSTLYDVLLTFSKVLAPFCPFITDAIYLNLVPGDHDSIHLAEWPNMMELTEEEKAMIQKTRLLRTIVSLGMGLRAEANVKVRQPLSKIEIAFPPNLQTPAGRSSQRSEGWSKLSPDEEEILMQELNVKEIHILSDASHLADRIVQVDARKAGPRLGGKVQEIIKTAKAGEFKENTDGTITVLGEKLSKDEASIMYRGKQGQAVASERGVVVALDTSMTSELKLEGIARDIIRSVQALRKEKNLKVSDRISLKAGEGMETVLGKFRELIETETNGSFGESGVITVSIAIQGEEAVADVV